MKRTHNLRISADFKSSVPDTDIEDRLSNTNIEPEISMALKQIFLVGEDYWDIKNIQIKEVV